MTPRPSGDPLPLPGPLSVFPRAMTRHIRLLAPLAVVVAASACQDLEVDKNQFGIINIPTVATGTGFTSRPSAFFFEGTSIRLSTTEIGSEGCVDRAIPSAPVESFDYIDAGPAVEVRLSGQAAELVRETSGGFINYELAGDQPIEFTPGDIVTVSIPGSVGGFPTAIVSARTVAPFTHGDVSLPASEADNLTLTWTNSGPIAPGSAMFHSLKYSTVGSAQFDREIACVFADDGSGVVTSNLLSGFRNSDLRGIVAQRALITIQRVGSGITHITSSYAVPVELVGDE